MGRQRNRPLMTEQENSSEKQLDEMEISNLSHREFRVIIIRILNSIQEDIETTEKDRSEMKQAILKRNNTLEGINSRLDKGEDPISVLEDKVEKKKNPTRQSSKKKKIILKDEERCFRALRV